MSDQRRQALTLEELQPPYEELEKQPQTLTRTRHIDDVLYVAGRSPVENQTQYDVMFITTAIEEDEATQHATSSFGFKIQQPAEYLKGPNGIVKDVALPAGIDLDKCYYTAICKWLLPRTQRGNPPMKIMRWGMPILMDEIDRVKPKIIVCMGKKAFDMVADQKIGFKDAHGCWFWSEKCQAHLYCMHAPYVLVNKPDMYETFRVDFKEVGRRKGLLDAGLRIADDKVNSQVIDNLNDLRDFMDHLEELAQGDDWPGLRDDDGNPLLSVDCEWHGRTHIDGDLRTIQFAWSEHDGAVVEFRNDQNQWSFDVDDSTGRGMQTGAILQAANDDELLEATKYAAAGKPIADSLARMNARFIGHHYAADAPWMKHKLGINIYRKCAMDTEFAQQTVDESSELGLERGIAMKYTNLGRYDQELTMWKRDNKKLCEEGYGFIPSSILHPYGVRDVISPYRAYPLIKRQLEAQQLWEYYRDLFNPFVTDVFTEFTMTGLPMDIPLMDDLRDLFTFTTKKLTKRLQRRIHSEAKAKLMNRLIDQFGILELASFTPLINNYDEEGLMNQIKKGLAKDGKMKEVNKWINLVRHFVDSVGFNIRSPDQMRRWLFDVEDLMPIKSTNQKAKGLPSMAWEKVLELPEERQRLYLPATDKQTLQILSEQLPTIDELLNVNAVGNLAKAFLKEPTEFLDEHTGEVTVEEHGLHAWLASTKRIHGQYSSTETGRPRSWAPNTLNWPSYVNKRIAKSVAEVIQEAHEEGDLPEVLMKWVGKDADDLPSIRSCVKAPPGWILVESDYATAEMVALAVISGDKDLQRILMEPDPDWVYLKPGNKYRAESVRVAFSGEDATGIPESASNPEFIMQVWEAGECLGPVTDDMILRDDDGNPVHAKYDIHWSLIERTYGLCREVMKAKVDRAAAKVLNFSSAYGATPNTLERKIESDTGTKPEPGTGERGLDAIAARQPRATEFLEELAEVPKKAGIYRACSGRLRHCLGHGSGSGVGWRTRNSIESALGREMRNFPMQESVGATSARACRWLLNTYRNLGMKARPMTCLYDSVVTLCPLEERFLVSRLHQICMSDMNTWDYKDDYGERTLQYTIDNDFNYRWSTSPTQEELDQLEDRSWHPPTDRWATLESHANLRMFVS